MSAPAGYDFANQNVFQTNAAPPNWNFNNTAPGMYSTAAPMGMPMQQPMGMHMQPPMGPGMNSNGLAQPHNPYYNQPGVAAQPAAMNGNVPSSTSNGASPFDLFD